MERKVQPREEIPRGIGKAGHGLKVGIVVVFALIITMGSLFFAHRTVGDKRAELVSNVEHRLGLVAQGRADVFEAWLSDLAHRGDRLIKSDLFRLYAAEVDGISGDLAAIFGAGGDVEGEGADLAAQLPMMQNILREFCTYSGFLYARVLNWNGVAYIATDGYLPPMSEAEIALVQSTYKEGVPLVSPLRKTPQGLEMDIYVPIYPPEDEEHAHPVGVLMMTRQVTGKITELLSNSALSAKGEHTRLMQRTASGFLEVTPWTPEGFSKVTAQFELDDKGNMPFAERTSLSNEDEKVFSMGMRIEGPQWWVVQEMDFTAGTASIQAYSRTSYIMAGLAILAILLAAGLAWWVQTGVYNQRSAEQFRALAAQIDEQKRFIDSINANIQEFITLKDLDGRYIYVNDAFAQAVGRAEHEILGMDTEAVFGFDTAKRLTAADAAVLEEKGKVIINETIYLQSRRHQFQISKSPYYDNHGNCLGVVEVFRDITDFVAAQERNKRLIRRAMEALGSTIEAADPYLGGHTKLMAGLAVEVGRVLNLDEIDVAEIETAANLSQIGKMFVPKEILTKPERLTDDEKEVMETHVEYAYRILKDIDIDEGVLRAIYQMNERMDGSGYPKRLKGEDIILPARILSVLNAFCAMIRPRAHRGAMKPEEVLRILTDMGDKYDPAVLQALSEAITSPAGERLLDQSS
ncbi:HD domain-containing phosphohydrolase [Salidesulfovibrio onnuriiensis]|uniref:HD domain-containing phosphohydrolase n=1 Tax=Salidesulfovibrio onnuriiensis TaxID=2583823 RepID=UPI0011C7105C|nr:HD domain-containing phosphohydrolase [Salidesulfovibrio onnuriiensis]